MFYRLIVVCDDYGRYDGDAAIIKGACFPLKKDLTEKQVEKALYKLSTAGMINLYESNGEPILQLTAWERHQNVRAKRSRYPAYDDNCTQMYANECNSSRNPNPNPDPNPDTDTKRARGEYHNVILSDEDVEKLMSEYPTDWQDRIEKLSAYMESTGKKYKNHLATIRNWARMDTERNAEKNTNTEIEMQIQEIRRLEAEWNGQRSD